LTYSFSQQSKNNLKNVHPFLRRLMGHALRDINFTVIDGQRGQKEQNQFVEDGKSQLKYPKSKHNADPSLAVDIAPYPIDWQAHERFTFLAGFIWGAAEQLGIDIRLGMDWDGDGKLVSHDEDESFLDLPHIELDVDYGPDSEFWPE